MIDKCNHGFDWDTFCDKCELAGLKNHLTELKRKIEITEKRLKNLEGKNES